MPDHQAEFDRRAGQIQNYLDQMGHRSRVVARDSCFISFSEGTTAADPEDARGLVGTVMGWFGGGSEERAK